MRRRNILATTVALLLLPGCDLTEAQMDQLVTQMLTPTGKPVPGWDAGTVDFGAVIMAAGKPQAFLDKSGGMPGVTLFAKAPAPPAGWADAGGEQLGSRSGPLVQTDLIRLAPDLVVTLSVPYRLQGRAMCFVAGGQLDMRFWRPAALASAPETLDMTAMRYLMKRYFGQAMAQERCFALRQDKASYRISAYNADGRPLGRVSRGDRLTRHDADQAMALLGLG